MTGKAKRLKGQLEYPDLPVYCVSCTAADLPGDVSWLAVGETRVHTALRIEKRRRDWLLGRWTAKMVVAALHELRGLSPVKKAEIEIQAAADGAPQLLVCGVRPPWTLSISHSSDRALCALVTEDVPLGCDIEKVEPRTPAFVADYFTANERDWVAAANPDDRPLLANLIWSAKESALKALRTGLRADTRSVEVLPHSAAGSAEGWHRLRVVEACSGVEFGGWWKVCEGFVETLAVRGAVQGRPVALPLR